MWHGFFLFRSLFRPLLPGRRAFIVLRVLGWLA
jgi:hypothetical protein